MDLSKGTFQQISNFKDSWIHDAYKVEINANLDCKCKVWCQRNLEKWEWSMDSWTDKNHHTFLFLHEEDAIEFENAILNNFKTSGFLRK